MSCQDLIPVLLIAIITAWMYNTQIHQTVKEENSSSESPEVSSTPTSEYKINNELYSKVVAPTQWILPKQVNNSPRYKCSDETDWPKVIKCPNHHPHIWSETRTQVMVASPSSRYGRTTCEVNIICSNIYDADAVGLVYF